VALIELAYLIVNRRPNEVKTSQANILKPAPEKTGISAMDWAIAMLKGFIHDVAKPIWVAT
jgi:hypothetical protein